MIISKEFIWSEDHFAYHITLKDNINSIIEKGLIPSLGQRSISACDNEKAIYFFDSLLNLNDWMEKLYSDKNKDDLEVLRFNLRGRKWYLHNGGEDFYLKRKVNIDKLEMLRLYDINNNVIPYSKLDYVDDIKYVWNSMKR